eukprot:762088-Hanusia_phi.AAC.1
MQSDLILGALAAWIVICSKSVRSNNRSSCNNLSASFSLLHHSRALPSSLAAGSAVFLPSSQCVEGHSDVSRREQRLRAEAERTMLDDADDDGRKIESCRVWWRGRRLKEIQETGETHAERGEVSPQRAVRASNRTDSHTS